MRHWWKFQLKTSAVILSLVMAAFFLFGLNAAVISRLYQISQLEQMKAGFILSLPVFFIAVFNLLFLPVLLTRAAKFVFIPLILFSALVSYASYYYGVIFSRGMIVNVLETDYAEATSYLSVSALIWFVLLGVMPAWFMSRITVVPSGRKIAYPALSAAFSALALALIACLYFQDYAMTLRNYTDLKKLVVPTYALSSTFKTAKNKFFTSAVPYRQIGLDAKQSGPIEGKKNLTVLIVGETARAANYQLNGYPRETNKYTEKLGVDFFKDVSSCGTETAVSVPCMFSNLGRRNYSLDDAESQDNLLDILKRAKIQLLWIDNDSGCKGVCKNIKAVDIRKEYRDYDEFCDGSVCLDGAFIPELEKQIASLENENTVIVLHFMGSHGPSYYKRYPASHAGFMPDCQRSDVQNCPHESLINTYDNTILYTDYVISGIIGLLQKNASRWNPSLLYLSDHGESLGEKGAYLHGLPYSFAPKEQKHIPLMTWFSASFLESNRLDKKCVQQKTVEEYSQDNLFHTLLGLAAVSTELYKKDLDMFSQCRAETVFPRKAGKSH